MVATLIQPRRARQLFPCWDEPELIATFNITVEHHIESKVLSNMPIRKYQPVDDDTIHTLFHTTPQMSTNDVAIIMYEVDELYEVLNSTKTVVNMWCRPHLIPHMKFAQYVAGNVTKYFEDWKHVKSVPKMDYVAIPNFEDKIWQTWGLVFYNEADIIYNEELQPAAFKIISVSSIAHHITYQWFHNGNFYHPFWSPLWLNEGFIMFLGTDIIDKAFPDSRIMDLFVVQVQHESCRLNTYFAINHFMEYTSNIPNINSLFPLSHIGAVVWRMLASVIANAFWMGMNTYLNTRFGYLTSKTPDDLWNDMQTAIDEFNLKQNCKLNVKEMMDIWTIQQYCPVLNVIRDYFSGRVKISKEFHDKLDWKPYFIPVTYTEETNINFNTTLPHWIIDYCLTKSNPEIEIQFNDKDKWIIFNIQQTGEDASLHSAGSLSPSSDNIANELEGLSLEEQERQRAEWSDQLAKVEEEIQTLRHVLANKIKVSQDLKRKLGISVWKELTDDVNQGLKNVKESHVYQKTESVLKSTAEKTTSILGGFGSGISMKLGQMRNSDSFRSLEERVGSACENIKTKVVPSRSNSTQSFDEALRESEAMRRASAAPLVTSPTIPEDKLLS